MDLHREQQQEVRRSCLRERRKRRRHPSLQMRLGRRQKPLDRFLVKVAQKEKESTNSVDSVSANESRPNPIINKFDYFMYIKFK
jgi:hypothetical protein